MIPDDVSAASCQSCTGAPVDVLVRSYSIATCLSRVGCQRSVRDRVIGVASISRRRGRWCATAATRPLSMDREGSAGPFGDHGCLDRREFFQQLPDAGFDHIDDRTGAGALVLLWRAPSGRRCGKSAPPDDRLDRQSFAVMQSTNLGRSSRTTSLHACRLGSSQDRLGGAN